LSGSVGAKIEAESGKSQSEMSEEIGIPRDKLGRLPKSEKAKKIIALAEKQAVYNPPNYFDLSGRNTALPANWKAKRFSYNTTLDDHYVRHAKGVGATNEQDYVNKASNFLHNPLGKTGEVFVTSRGQIFKYDRETTHFAIAYMDSKGTIQTYKNLEVAKGTKELANAYWEKQVKKFKEA